MKINFPHFTPAEYKKGIAAVGGFVAEGISLGLFHGSALAVATAIVGIATSSLVVGLKNKPQIPVVTPTS